MKTLFLVDDGWRYEKRQVLNALKKTMPFTVITHNAQTHDMLKDDFDVLLLEKKNRSGFLYYVGLFFATELATNNIRYREEIAKRTDPLWKRIVWRLHKMAAALVGRGITYDRVLKWVYRSSNMHTELLKDADMLIFSPVSTNDKRILFEAESMGLYIAAWIYSWDNPFKDNEFFRSADLYLVWNSFCRERLIELNGIPEQRIAITGPAQFDYFAEYQQTLTAQNTNDEPYVLFACCTYRDEHIEQEVELMLLIARIMEKVAPNHKLYVRPYPFRIDDLVTQKVYERLENIDNVKLLDYGKIDVNKRLLQESDIREKFLQIRGADCFINLGSTLGLEASFSTTPILQIDFHLPHSFSSCYGLVELLKNDHLRLIFNRKYPNVVQSPEALQKALQKITSGEVNDYVQYSYMLNEAANPIPGTNYTTLLAEKLQAAKTIALSRAR